MAVELVLLGAGAEGSLWALKEILPKNEPVWSLKADLETRHGGGADSKYGSRAWPSEVHPEELPSPQAWNRAVPITAWWVLGRLFTKMSNRDLRGLEDRVLEHSGRNALRTQLCTAQASPAHRSLPSSFCSVLILCSRFSRLRQSSTFFEEKAAQCFWDVEEAILRQGND